MKIGSLEINWVHIRTILLWIALPLIVGILIALAIPRPVIGIIHLDTEIDSFTAQNVITQIDYARQHSEVRAVVLMVDSPGGTVADTESIYQEILDLRKTKPVVTSISGMDASGAFYLSVGTDYIIANPTSDVGNIGVIGYLPDNPTIFESIASTGPYKMWGEARDVFLREMEMIKQGFFQAVKLGRGSRLKAGPEVILSGRIWPGSEAYRLGLIDALGSQSDAYEKAAHLANVGHYQVVDLAPLAGIMPTMTPNYAYTAGGQANADLSKNTRDPGLYLLYIPPMTGGK
jgi:protease-4